MSAGIHVEPTPCCRDCGTGARAVSGRTANPVITGPWVAGRLWVSTTWIAPVVDRGGPWTICGHWHAGCGCTIPGDDT
eukprot:scaffold298519_cov37-Tisochrysis_lutea.AAC.2